MQRKWMLGYTLVLMICIVCSPGIGFSKTGYVSDSLILTFREGPGREFPVVQSLKSDTPVTILEEKEKYYKVRLDSGETGWVDSQYIVFTPTKQILIDQLKREKQDLEKQLASMKAVLKKEQASSMAADEKREQLVEELSQIKQDKSELADKLASANHAYEELKIQNKDAATLLQQIKTLAQANEQLLEKIKKLKERQKGKFSFLKDPGLIKWFLAGVGVLLLGWLLGHNVSSRKDNRRRSLLD